MNLVMDMVKSISKDGTIRYYFRAARREARVDRWIWREDGFPAYVNLNGNAWKATKGKGTWTSPTRAGERMDAAGMRVIKEITKEGNIWYKMPKESPNHQGLLLRSVDAPGFVHMNGDVWYDESGEEDGTWIRIMGGRPPREYL